jgi:hypothetical protein
LLAKYRTDRSLLQKEREREREREREASTVEALNQTLIKRTEIFPLQAQE